MPLLNCPMIKMHGVYTHRPLLKTKPRSIISIIFLLDLTFCQKLKTQLVSVFIIEFQWATKFRVLCWVHTMPWLIWGCLCLFISVWLLTSICVTVTSWNEQHYLITNKHQNSVTLEVPGRDISCLWVWLDKGFSLSARFLPNFFLFRFSPSPFPSPQPFPAYFHQFIISSVTVLLPSCFKACYQMHNPANHSHCFEQLCPLHLVCITCIIHFPIFVSLHEN